MPGLRPANPHTVRPHRERRNTAIPCERTTTRGWRGGGAVRLRSHEGFTGGRSCDQHDRDHLHMTASLGRGFLVSEQQAFNLPCSYTCAASLYTPAANTQYARTRCALVLHNDGISLHCLHPPAARRAWRRPQCDSGYRPRQETPSG
ncbi:hypothetical protein GDO78_021399 [Eleutherodactylus coqui]|uniref:Uncharacterized protein n=1 Tax=Eleutherodactylus coqui TaxID=57060 RepID=A0A8J6B3U1_ELECQ|nr:hypothetical protein GDO78_021399 [Eleutherodactylus coqui]